MMHITILTTDVEPLTGWGSATRDLCEGLLKRPDVDFQVLVRKTARRDYTAPFADKVRYVLPKWASSFQKQPQKLWSILFGRLDVGRTDLLHAFVEFPYAILARRMAREQKIPYMVSTHGTYGVVPFFRWTDRSLYKEAMRDAAIVTAPSTFAAGEVTAASGLARTVEVVPNPINFARFQKPADVEQTKDRFGIPQDARIILSVGALKEQKGFDVLIKAFARMHAEDERLLLIIAGHGSQRTLRKWAKRLGVGDRVRLLGALGGVDLVGLYQASEIFALLPRASAHAHREAFGLVYLEAGACGKPVVGTESGGVSETVLSGETGFLVREEDELGAALAMKELVSDRACRAALGENGKIWAARHDMHFYAERMTALYERAVDPDRSVLHEVGV